jgi:hypothetical protein
MTNVYGHPKKGDRKSRLFQIGVQTLQTEGWTVERITGFGKSSVRRITKSGKSNVVSIRTTQDTCIAFPRNKQDTGWGTLADVDFVVAVSVDDPDDPNFALVHMIPGEEMRGRFDRAYAARVAAGHSIPLGRGVWLPLYIQDSANPTSHVGGGAGLDHPAVARVPLTPEDVDEDTSSSEVKNAHVEEEPLTISEAKRRLAISLGVSPSNIKITVEA